MNSFGGEGGGLAAFLKQQNTEQENTREKPATGDDFSVDEEKEKTIEKENQKFAALREKQNVEKENRGNEHGKIKKIKKEENIKKSSGLVKEKKEVILKKPVKKTFIASHIEKDHVEALEKKIVKTQERVVTEDTNFQDDLKTQIFELLEKEEIIDPNNSEKMQMFLADLADFWEKTKKETKTGERKDDFAVLRDLLGRGDEGLEALTENQKKYLLNVFNKSILRTDGDSFLKFLEKYVDVYPKKVYLAGQEASEYKVFQKLDKKEFDLTLIEDLPKNESERASFSLGLYLDYLSVLQEDLKKELFDEFDNLDKEMLITFEEIEALRKANRTMDDFKEEGFLEEDAKEEIELSQAWSKYINQNRDWQKLSRQYKKVERLRASLERKISHGKDLESFNNPENFRSKIENEELEDFWIGSKSNKKDLLKKLSFREREDFLRHLDKGDIALAIYTKKWLKKTAYRRLRNLEGSDGYLRAKNKENQRRELRESIDNLFEIWPKNLSEYSEEKMENFITEWFAAHKYKKGDEGDVGKLIRLDFLLQNANNTRKVRKGEKIDYIFLKDDKSFNQLRGEIDELRSKEIELAGEDFLIVKKLLEDDIFANIISNSKLISLLEDIYTNDNLTKVQELEWNILIDKLGNSLEKKLDSYRNYDAAVMKNLDLISDFDKELGLFKPQKNVVFTARKLSLMYDLYNLLEKS